MKANDKWTHFCVDKAAVLVISVTRHQKNEKIVIDGIGL